MLGLVGVVCSLKPTGPAVADVVMGSGRSYVIPRQRLGGDGQGAYNCCYDVTTGGEHEGINDDGGD